MSDENPRTEPCVVGLPVIGKLSETPARGYTEVVQTVEAVAAVAAGAGALIGALKKDGQKSDPPPQNQSPSPAPK